MLEGYAAAKLALDKLHRELMDFNPSAARSLAEGMEETLTEHRLEMPMQLRLTLAGTKVIDVGVRYRGARLRRCEALASGRSTRALG